MRSGLAVLKKVLAILPVVQANQGIRVSELARATGIPEEEIATDLPALINLCGVPPYTPADLVDLTVEGDRVTIRFAGQFRRPVRLTLREAFALDMALAGFEEDGDSPFALAIAGIRVKVRSALSPAVKEELSHAGDRISLVRSPGRAGRILKVLRDALNRQVEVEMDYFSRSSGEISRRVIRPYGFYELSGHWYVVAFSKEKDKVMTFRADRIRDVNLTNCEYEIPEDFEVADFRRAGPPAPSGEGLTVRVRFDPSVARFARESFPAQSFIEEPEGTVLAEVETTATPWLISELLRWGGRAEVVSPASVVAELEEKIRATLAAYGREA